jgi:hypothetical protein
VSISYRLADVPLAATAYIHVTAPSGAQTNFACSPRPVRLLSTIGRGVHFYQVVYLSSSGGVVSQSQPDLSR